MTKHHGQQGVAWRERCAVPTRSLRSVARGISDRVDARQSTLRLVGTRSISAPTHSEILGSVVRLQRPEYLDEAHAFVPIMEDEGDGIVEG
jgi:hypothetical protein